MGRRISTQAVGQSVVPETLTESRRVSKFSSELALLLSTKAENPVKVNESSCFTGDHRRGLPVCSVNWLKYDVLVILQRIAHPFALTYVKQSD